jgi:hypothetical protein
MLSYPLLYLLALVAEGSPLWGQADSIAPRYSVRQLNCSRFLERSESRILTQSGHRDQEQTSGRAGVWRFKVTGGDRGLELEGWLDSLEVWRRSAEATIRPDTDGLIGGRYRGGLSPRGEYSSRANPFIPDEVAEIAGMATALNDFFPPLPPRPLKRGESWNSSAGVTIQRMPDSALSGVPLYRFRLQQKQETRTGGDASDSLQVPTHQVLEEDGAYTWHPLLGMIERERRIVIETTVPASRSVPQAIRSKIRQHVRVVRDLTTRPDSAGSCPASTTSTSNHTRAGSASSERYSYTSMLLAGSKSASSTIRRKGVRVHTGSVLAASPVRANA